MNMTHLLSKSVASMVLILGWQVENRQIQKWQRWNQQKKNTHAHTQYQYNLRIDRKSMIKAAVIKIETLQALSLLKRL